MKNMCHKIFENDKQMKKITDISLNYIFNKMENLINNDIKLSKLSKKNIL